MRLPTIRQIHKLILKGKLKWIKNVQGLSPQDIRVLYRAQAQTNGKELSEDDFQECLEEQEKPLGGM